MQPVAGQRRAETSRGVGLGSTKPEGGGRRWQELDPVGHYMPC